MSLPNIHTVYEIYNTPEINDMLKTAKSINELISKKSIKIVNINKNGTSSSAALYKFPNDKIYIVRKTPLTYISKNKLENELEIYNILLSKPESINYISKLVYGDTYLTEKKDYSYFIFEYENGDILSEYINKNINSLSIKEVMNIYNHLQNAIAFLEENKVIHRDIKPDNIYYSTDRNIPLLFDFDISCYGPSCLSAEYAGSPEYSTPSSKLIRGQEGFTLNTRFYRYSSNFDRYSLAVLLEKDLKKLVKDEDKETIINIAEREKHKYNSANISLQSASLQSASLQSASLQSASPKIKKGGYKKKEYNRMSRNIQKNKTRKGGRIGVMNPTWGGACPCQAVPKIPIPLGELQKGGYKPSKRDLKYLKLWKQGKSIGFTMRSSLKAKGLIPRVNGTRRVSTKYRK